MSEENYKGSGLFDDLPEYEKEVFDSIITLLGHCNVRSGTPMSEKLRASNKLLSEIKSGLVKGVGNLNYVDKKYVPETGKA